MSPWAALSRKRSSLLGKVAGTAGNYLVGAVALSSRAGERGTHQVGAIADDAQIELVRKESGCLQANGCLALYTCVWHVYGMWVHTCVCMCVCVCVCVCVCMYVQL